MSEMRQATGATVNPRGRIFMRLRLLWPLLVALAAFVFFLNFIADVGGSAEPTISPPLPAATATPSPSPQPAATLTP